MRVSDGGARPREAGEQGRPRRFGDALRKAGQEASGGKARPRKAADPAAPGRAVAVRRSAAVRADDALREKKEGFRGEERALDTRSTVPAASPAEPVSTPELRALVRTLPLAIQTFGLRDGAPLALSFGRSLDVELRAVPGGVELVLRPEARLARAAAAELPRVVAALGAKGITVARAEIRSRPAGAAAAGGSRVDLPTGVR